MFGRSAITKSTMLVFVLGLALVATSCQSSGKKGPATTTQATTQVTMGDDGTKDPRGTKDNDGPPVVREEPALKTIYFDYDKSSLRDDQMQRLRDNLAWIKENGQYEVILEGHCDERGSNGYNLALGERRADSVHDFLMSNGVSANRLTPISKGEEDLVVENATTQAEHQQNRRVKFLILGN